MISCKYYAKPINMDTVRRRQERRIEVKGLTQQELIVLMRAEDVLFSHLDDELNGVFSDSAIALHKAKKKYIELMLKEVGSVNKKVIEAYYNYDIIALNELYNEKVGE